MFAMRWCLMFAATLLLSARADAGDPEDNTAELKAAAGAAERDGDRLILHLRSGKTVTFEDLPLCVAGMPPTCLAHWYRFHSYDRSKGLFVIWMPCDECQGYLIVDDRSGKETDLYNEPHFSPNGNLAVELVYGEDSGYSGDRPAVNIWRRVGAKFKREWSTPIVAEHNYSVLGWSSNDRVDVEELTQASRREDPSTRVFSVVRDGKRWRIVDKSPAAMPK